MSQFSTMTTRERKMQAAAICREVQGPEGKMDLGKKVSVPKDIMLEELSFASNRGSRLFKMRQRRSEKYTFESIQNEANKQSNVSYFKEMPCRNTHNRRIIPTNHSPLNLILCALISSGYGGPLKDIPPEKFNSTAIPKSYHSPWEQAIINDPNLADTLISHMPEPEPLPELPGYKSFNRVATPFGGFGKTPSPAPIKSPQVEPLPDYPELRGETAALRPSFNRTALGWVSVGTPVLLPTISLEPMFIPESDDL
uniref:Myozenin 2a n=1 Tax=Myripristis murdjan TaxID=586833 RepID=A0A667YRM6_9TELE